MFAWVDECDGDGDGEKGTRSGRGGVASGGRGGDGRVCKKHKEPCAFFEVKREVCTRTHVQTGTRWCARKQNTTTSVLVVQIIVVLAIMYPIWAKPNRSFRCKIEHQMGSRGRKVQ